MNRKTKLVQSMALSLILVLVLAATALAAYKYLSVPQYQSRYACWSASSAHVSAFFKNVTSETAIIDYERRIYRNKYPDPEPTCQGGSVADMVAGVRLITGISGYYQLNPLSYTAVKYQTNNNGPICAALTNYLQNGWKHAITIRGYNDEGAEWCYFSDPYDGKYNRASHSYLVNTWKWVNSAFWK